MYFAHSTSDQSQSDWQPLAEHLRDVAALAAQFGSELGLGKAAYLAGLLHDLGKYSPRFQARLHGGKEPVDHSTAGAAIACASATGDDRIIAKLVARGGVDRNNVAYIDSPSAGSSLLTRGRGSKPAWVAPSSKAIFRECKPYCGEERPTVSKTYHQGLVLPLVAQVRGGPWHRYCHQESWRCSRFCGQRL